MIYTVTCNPSLDYTMHINALSRNTVHRTTKETITYGGKGINVSVILSRLGFPTQALGFCGGFSGEKLKSLLHAEHVPYDFVPLSKGETRINVKIRADAEWDISASGPPVTAEETKALMDKLDALTADDALVLAGSIPNDLPDDLYVRMLTRIQGRNVLVAVDAEKELLRRVLPFRPFLIKPNHHELGDLFGTTAETVETIVALARSLQQEGARNVLVSRAENGAVLLDENGQVHTIGSATVPFRNSVGCGDSMVAGFLAGWLQSHNYEEALRLASAAGGATAAADFLATREDMEQVLSQFR